MVMPPVRTRDDLDLPLSSYAIRISGVDAGTGQAPPGTVLAIGDGLQALPGRAGVEPVFGLAGKWVPAELHYQAELSGATVVDRASVIITHLAEIVRQQRQPPARPRGRPVADRDGQAHPPGRGRGADPVAAEPRPDPAGAAGAARRGRADPRPGPDLRGAVAARQGLRRPRRPGRGGPRRARPGHRRPVRRPAAGSPSSPSTRCSSRACSSRCGPSETGAFMAIDGMRAEAIVTEAGRLVEAAEQQGITAGAGLLTAAAAATDASPAGRLPPGAGAVLLRDFWFHRTDRDHGGGERCLRGCCLRGRPSSRCWRRCATSTAPRSGSSRPTRSAAVASAGSSPSSTTSCRSRSRTPTNAKRRQRRAGPGRPTTGRRRWSSCWRAPSRATGSCADTPAGVDRHRRPGRRPGRHRGRGRPPSAGRTGPGRR